MNEDRRIRALRPRREAVDGVCVDCGREVAAAEVARVLRIDGQGRGRVVCNECSARIHAARQPAPIPLQRPVRKAGTEDAHHGDTEAQRAHRDAKEPVAQSEEVGATTGHEP